MKVVQTKIKSVDYYALLGLDSISVGDTMAFDVFIKKSNNYIVIIEAGTLLSKKLYKKLEKQTELYIFKKDKEKLSLTCESLKYYIKYNRGNLEKRIQFLYEVNTKFFDEYLNNKENKLDLICLNSIVKSIIYLIKYDKDFLKNTMPSFINEHNLADHSLST